MTYYLETNLVAIVIAIVLLIQGRKLSSKNESSQIIMNVMLILLLLFSISDISAYYFRGKSYLGVEISNIIYFLCMALGAYVWFVFITVKMKKSYGMKLLGITPIGIPIYLLCLAMVLNPWTNFFFSVDEQLLYHRGPGVLLTWVVEWGYVIAAIGINVNGILKEKKSYWKWEYKGYLWYPVPMAVAAVCQMKFYGTTTLQLGYAVALLSAYLNKQYYQAQQDELTKLNNRIALMSYQDYILNKEETAPARALLIDVDDFKAINDTYGHLKGDQALRDISNVLKTAAGPFERSRLMICRYGGDEFLIMACHINDEDMAVLREGIEAQLDKQNRKNREAGERYVLSLSMGASYMMCGSAADFEQLIRSADEEMYKEKRRKKRR